MKKMNFPFGNNDPSQWNNQEKNFMNNKDQFWEDGPAIQNNWTFTNSYENFRYRAPNFYQNQTPYQPVNFSSNKYINKKYAISSIRQKPKHYKYNTKEKLKLQQKLITTTSPSSPPPGSEEYRLRMIENSKALVTEKLKNLNKEELPEINPPEANGETVLNNDQSKVVCVNDSLDDLKLNVNDLKRIGRIGCPQISLEDEQEEEEKGEESIREENQNNDISNNIINKKFNTTITSPPRNQSSKIINSPRSEGSITKVLSCMKVSMKRESKQNISPILVKRKKRYSSEFNIQDFQESDKKNDLQKEETISRNIELNKNHCNKFLKDIINNPGPGRFNYELHQLIRSKRSQLSREMRKLAQERIQNLLRKQDNPLLSHIADDLLADPDMAINLSSLPEEVINELTNILGIDINNFEAIDMNLVQENMANPFDGNSIINPLEDNFIKPLEDNFIKPLEDNFIKPLEDNFIKPLEEGHFEKGGKPTETLTKTQNFVTVNMTNPMNENSLINPSEENFMKSLEKRFEKDKTSEVLTATTTTITTTTTTSTATTKTQPPQSFPFNCIRVKQEFLEKDNLEMNDYENDNVFLPPTNSISYFSDSSTQTLKKSQDISTQTLEEDNNLIKSSNEPENNSLILKRMNVIETQNNDLRSLVLSLKQDILNLQTSLQSPVGPKQIINKSKQQKKKKINQKKPEKIITIDEEKRSEKKFFCINKTNTSTNSTNTSINSTNTCTNSTNTCTNSTNTSTNNTNTSTNSTNTISTTTTTSTISNAGQIISFEGPKGSINDIQTLYHKTYIRLLIAASEDGFIYLYSFYDGKLLRKYGKDCGSITALSLIFCPNSGLPTIYSGSNDGFFRIFDFENEEEIIKINLYSPIQCIEKSWGFHFIGTSSGQVYKHRAKGTAIQESFTFSKNPIFSLTATKEGPRKVLVVGARKESISVRDAFSGLLLRIFNSEFTTVYKIIIEKNLLYCGTTKANVHVYQFQSGEKSFELPSGAGTICLKNYFNLLFSGGYNGNVYVFLTKTKELISTIKCTDTMILSLDIWNNMIFYGDKNGHIKAINFPQNVLDNLEKIKNDDK